MYSSGCTNGEALVASATAQEFRIEGAAREEA
jgi:hypothetical protein